MEYAASVDQLRLKFPGEKSLQFRDLSLSIFSGENVLILGPSGCGKSTLLQVLTGIIPNSIEVPVKYEKITVPDSWGYVFQDPDTQFCMPYVDEEMAFVLENLQVPREEMPERIDKYLQMAGLPMQDSHQSIQTLSQGMKQRLAIASVLALEPEVLFLDEPTALLDPEGTMQVWQTIKEAADKKTLVIVEHKIEHIVDIVDRVILFNREGEIIADGNKQHIFEHYKKQLIEYGIWYPGVWDDYISSAGYKRLRDLAEKQIQVFASDRPALEIHDFIGYRGKEPKIEVSHESVFPGQWIAMIGENGAGKSTLLLALMQLIRTTGHYNIHSTSVDQFKNLAEQIAFVFQNPEFQFVTNSVYEEVAYSLKIDRLHEREISLKVEELLDFFGLKEKRTLHPYQLSMGQKRRLSVASAVIKEQKIVMLDEPTFGQDAQNTFAILEKLEAWRSRGTIIIMVTHDTEIVKHFATRVWLIDQAKLVLDVTPERYFEKMADAAADGKLIGTLT